MQKRKTVRSRKIAKDLSAFSICPAGKIYPLPAEKDFLREFERLRKIVGKERRKGREIVVVMGLGFVGAVMAGVIADSTDRKTGKPSTFVIGMQRPSTRSYWKIGYLNNGIPPVEAEDPEVARLIERCVRKKKTLMATYIYDALALDALERGLKVRLVVTAVGS
jgi:hypothetical protein